MSASMFPWGFFWPKSIERLAMWIVCGRWWNWKMRPHWRKLILWDCFWGYQASFLTHLLLGCHEVNSCVLLSPSTMFFYLTTCQKQYMSPSMNCMHPLQPEAKINTSSWIAFLRYLSKVVGVWLTQCCLLGYYKGSRQGKFVSSVGTHTSLQSRSRGFCP